MQTRALPQNARASILLIPFTPNSASSISFFGLPEGEEPPRRRTPHIKNDNDFTTGEATAKEELLVGCQILFSSWLGIPPMNHGAVPFSPLLDRWALIDPHHHRRLEGTRNALRNGTHGGGLLPSGTNCPPLQLTFERNVDVEHQQFLYSPSRDSLPRKQTTLDSGLSSGTPSSLRVKANGFNNPAASRRRKRSGRCKSWALVSTGPMLGPQVDFKPVS